MKMSARLLTEDSLQANGVFVAEDATWWDLGEEIPLLNPTQERVGEVTELYRQNNKVYGFYVIEDEEFRSRVSMYPEMFYLAPYCDELVEEPKASEDDIRVIIKMRLRSLSILSRGH